MLWERKPMETWSNEFGSVSSVVCQRHVKEPGSVFFLFPVKPWDNSCPSQQIDHNLMRELSRKHSMKNNWTPYPQNLWDNQVWCFKPINLGVLFFLWSHSTLTPSPGFKHKYRQLICKMCLGNKRDTQKFLMRSK